MSNGVHSIVVAFEKLGERKLLENIRRRNSGKRSSIEIVILSEGGDFLVGILIGENEPIDRALRRF